MTVETSVHAEKCGTRTEKDRCDFCLLMFVTFTGARQRNLIRDPIDFIAMRFVLRKQVLKAEWQPSTQPCSN